MNLLDIHSHILPGVDDGAKDIVCSVKLLEMMKEQGITNVIATPHFYAFEDNLENFTARITSSYNHLKAVTDGLSLPQIHLGAEVFYFDGIGQSESIRSLCLAGTDYLLLELPNCTLDSCIIKDITHINTNLGIIPIVAHIERYCKQRGFKKLLKLVENRTVYAQVNALSVLQPPYSKIANRLIKKGYISFIATDTHSVVNRPPLMNQALRKVEKLLGEKYKDMFIANSKKLLSHIRH
ncbi:MAG: hypothetical protein IJ470_00745 [Clostridia bacterium]|nr:hypothetical protein [Clostridia bacterium]